MTRFLVLAICASMMLTFTSAKVSQSKEEVAVQSTPNKSAISQMDASLTYKERVAIAESIKGEKLSLKEKIALKLFKKKEGGKSQVIALILVVLLGGLGIHRFYLGYTWQGVVQLLTAGGCGIWALIDLIRIITGSLQPKDGSYDKTL